MIPSQLGDFDALFRELEEADPQLAEADPEWDDDEDYGDGEELTPEQVAEYLAAKETKRCEPVPYKFKATKKIIAIVDSETDPFDTDLVPAPFAIGFDLPDRYVDFWGDDCVEQFFAYLATLTAEGDEFIIYAHNGGKFDFFFFLDYLDVDQSPLIMNGRLVKIDFGGQEFRDSFAIIPWALGKYKKEVIDYNKFKRHCREQNKEEIRGYLRSDCTYLRDLVTGFHELFGDKLTIASAALPMLNSFHGFERIRGDGFDERFRQYYYGGRNQCFETGILRPKYGEQFSIYDRNSMYSAVMRDELHPVSNRPRLQSVIDDETDFAMIEAINKGALPSRGKDGGLDFTKKRGDFYATIHEIKAGLETGTLEIIRVKHAWAFDIKTTFDGFVNSMYERRLEARANDDIIRDLLYKTCLNAPYGKFALNPRKFRQWQLTIGEVPQPQATESEPNGWSLHTQSGDMFIWSRPSPRKGGFYNVATAASITGAARANLLRNISKAKRPIYCDTDSIICEGLSSIDGLGDAMGQWKLEGQCDRLAIAGKKLYAAYDQTDIDGAIKKASKGVQLSPAEIIAVCNGAEIIHQNPVPNFQLDGTADFITRSIRKTG